MKNNVFAIIILLIFSVICQDACSKEKTIDMKQLSWSDFKGIPDPNSRYDSYTYWYVYYEYDAPVIQGNEVKINFRVWNELGSNSWIKFNTPRENQKQELLNHEQGHFYIGAICALDLKKRFSEYKYSKNNYQQEIKNIFDQTLSEYVAWEKKYDIETNHMYNRQAQKKWDTLFHAKIRGSNLHFSS